MGHVTYTIYEATTLAEVFGPGLDEAHYDGRVLVHLGSEDASHARAALSAWWAKQDPKPRDGIEYVVVSERNHSRLKPSVVAQPQLRFPGS